MSDRLDGALDRGDLDRGDLDRDVLTEVLVAAGLGGALSARSEATAPWALHVDDDHQFASFHVVASGRCCVQVDDDGSVVEAGAGDVLVFPHGSGHVIGDHPDTRPIEFAEFLATVPRHGTLRLGGDGPLTTLLCGSYTFAATGPSPLLHGLPSLIHVPAERLDGTPAAAAVHLLAAEAQGSAQGATRVVERLVDLLFIYVLRAWLDSDDGAATATWFGALHDPVVGPALRAIHADPGFDWTVATLARRSGLSRAPFARRFRDHVGEPPVTYVTRWRMTVAADRLTAGESIAATARAVGYDNEFAFAKAFKRVCGEPPGEFRRNARVRSVGPVPGAGA
jgi:AraC-like DNA-binding protein